MLFRKLDAQQLQMIIRVFQLILDVVTYPGVGSIWQLYPVDPPDSIFIGYKFRHCRHIYDLVC